MRTARILIVEDESVVAWHVQEALHTLGHQVVAIANSARQAIQIATNQRPDLVLMDICLQGKNDGVSAAEYLYLKLNLPVVYLTAHADEYTLRRATETSPFGYVVKPFQEAVLQSAIQVALRRHQMEVALKDTQQWYATTLVSIGDATIATDVDGFITFMNPAAEFFTGWTQEEALGEFAGRVLDLIDEETRAAIDNPILAALCQGDTITLPDRAVLRSRDGTERPVGDSASPIRNRDGEIIGGVMVFQDMSDRRQRESSLDAQRQILETTQSLLCAQLKERTEQLQFAIGIDRLRQRVFDRCDADRTEVLSWMLEEIGHTLKLDYSWIALHDPTSTVSTIVAEFNSPEAEPRSLIRRTIELSKFSPFYLRLFQRQCWICPEADILPPLYVAQSQVIICPIQGESGTVGEFGLILPNYPRWSGFQADAIAQLVSQALRAYQSAQQIQTFRAEITELQHLKALQKDFIEALSHELRTPLTNMRMAIELMQKIALSLDDPEAPNPQVERLERYLKILQQEWHEEYSLVNDLLAFQNASSGSEAIPLSEVRIHDWLTVTIERFANQTAIAVQLELSTEPMPKLWVHIPTLEKTIVQLLTHLNHADPELPIQLRTFINSHNFCISVCCLANAEEVLPRRKQNVSNLRLALLRRYAMDLNATVTIEQHSGTTVLTLNLPIRAS
ncbi:hybrid sensor histidine kinase/response regulator [Leptolyngbya sp. NIES-2104]|uniref:hybrid sensor histidine kinase/response regulator n=1 Tax=Leptolyngbya sp. NIES-2104 TaxID=1552121 RepID=UPI0006EC74A3|nr:response regulator [Leptolyngbya sp. NIES-2104]GAP93655.1 two-component sensor histidine kinase [Leptolyngbya sp. NIES-2104]